MTMKILTLNKKNITDFASARNDLLDKSASDWNLFLDSDERLSKKINQSFSKSLNQYALERKNFFLGQYVGSDKIVRLVKKGTGKWQRAVHETWTPNKTLLPAGRQDSRCGILNSVIIHNTADNLVDYLSKINNYSTLHAKENKKESKISNIFKIIFFPMAKFIITLIKSRNIVFSIMQSLHSYLSWTKLYLRQY